jgi:hypothetical protein
MFGSQGFEPPRRRLRRETARQEASQGRYSGFSFVPYTAFLIAGVSLPWGFQQVFQSQFGEFLVLLAMPAGTELTVRQSLQKPQRFATVEAAHVADQSVLRAARRLARQP